MAMTLQRPMWSSSAQAAPAAAAKARPGCAHRAVGAWWPFDFNQFDELYDLRMVLETTAVHRLCESAVKINPAMLLRAHIETSPAEVRKITLHQVHEARMLGAQSAV